MYITHCDRIVEGDNVIVGLGDSFTQGVGAYSLDTWKSIPSNPPMYNVSGQYFIEEQGNNNWVRQICKSFLPNYKTYSLGVNGAGNRAAVKELYLNPLPKNLGNVVVVLMATGMERFDLFKQSDATAGMNWHQKWQTIWPTVTDRGPISALEKQYKEQIWSPRNDALEFLLNVRDAQNFCRANGYKFLFASAFDSQISRKNLLRDLGDKSKYIDVADWTEFINVPERDSFMDMINQLDGNKYRSMHSIFQANASATLPSKYITPCSHWTIEGQLKVAEYLFNEMTLRKMV